MKRLTKKKSIFIAIMYTAIAFGVIGYFNLFPPEVWENARNSMGGMTLAGYYPNYTPYYWSILLFGIGAIILFGILFYYTEWKKKPPTKDE